MRIRCAALHLPSRVPANAAVAAFPFEIEEMREIEAREPTAESSLSADIGAEEEGSLSGLRSRTDSRTESLRQLFNQAITPSRGSK